MSPVSINPSSRACVPSFSTPRCSPAQTLCRRDGSVSHNLRGKGLWEEQLSGGQSINFHPAPGCGPGGDAARGAAVSGWDFGAQGAGLWLLGQILGQRGRARLWEPLFRSLAGAGLPLESSFGELGSCESSSCEVLPQEQSKRKHCSSRRHEGGEREAPPGGRDGAGKLGRVSRDHPGTGVGGSWPQGLRSGRQFPLGRRVSGSAGSPR